MSDFDQLVRASRLYYELGETQNAIAEQLGVTRPQVSRLLKRARAEGIVEIRIVDRTAVESPAADALRAGSGSTPSTSRRRVAGPEELTRRMVGRLAAEVLRGVIRDGAMVGIGDGASVGCRRRRARGGRRRRSRVTVVPLCGGYWSTGPEREPYRRIADALGGQPHGLMAPGLRRRRRHASGRSSRTPASAAIIDLWDRLDVALFGIGGPTWSAASVGDDVAARARRAARRSARSSSRRSTSMAGSSARPSASGSSPSMRARCAASRSRSASRRARARSGRSSARCGPASSDARHRRRDGRGRRRARRRDARIRRRVAR